MTCVFQKQRRSYDTARRSNDTELGVFRSSLWISLSDWAIIEIFTGKGVQGVSFDLRFSKQCRSNDTNQVSSWRTCGLVCLAGQLLRLSRTKGRKACRLTCVFQASAGQTTYSVGQTTRIRHFQIKLADVINRPSDRRDFAGKRYSKRVV
jgi:hypothetical protein